MKLKAVKEPLLISIFTTLLIYFSFFQSEKNIALSEHLPPNASIIFEGTVEEVSKSPLMHTLENSSDSILSNRITELLSMKEIQKNKLLVASLPKESLIHERRWAMIIQLGNKVPWIKNKLNQLKHSSWNKLENIAACPVWELKSKKSETALRVTTTENLLIACKSLYLDDIKLMIYYSHY